METRYLEHNLKTFSDLEKSPTSKGDIFRGLDCTFDYNLPQDWLDDFSLFCREYQLNLSYQLILSTTVWALPEGNYFGLPCFCCEETKNAYIFYLQKEQKWEPVK